MALEQEKQLYLNGVAITPTQVNKINLLGNESGSGEPYHFTYFYTVTPEAEQVKVGIETITLDNNKTLKHYEMPIGKMDGTNAGLYTKALADAKSDKTYVDEQLTLKLNKDAIVDNLESPMTDYALSARMGKELNETKLGIDAKITSEEINALFSGW